MKPDFPSIKQQVMGMARLLRGSTARRLCVTLLACLSLLALPLRSSYVLADPAPPTDARLMRLGPGDSISIQVYGQPDMSSTEYVADDGSINVPLVGHVQVAGISPVEAGTKVEKALAKGQFLVDPHVTISIVQSRSQRVIVLGEVRTPGRYTVDPNSSIMDLLAQAGGLTDKAADTAFVLRDDGKGNTTRTPVDLKGMSVATGSLSTLDLRGGDSVLVPPADQYYIYGEVTAPNKYKLEPGMTVIQAIARAGGITPRGSDRRVEIKRPGKDGKYTIIHAKADDLIAPDDVIRVKESIF
jgi:polysaccharide export outer membrane protein